jgi:serine/threonine protein kinase
MSEPESGHANRIRDENAEGGEGGDRAEVSAETSSSGAGSGSASGSASASGSSGTGAVPSAEETAALLKQLTIGTTIDGKYRVDEIIGKGAMGVVVAATHVHLRERVALKFLSARAHAQADDFHTRFRREAQVSAKLRNEHITRVLDVGMWRDKVPFMVMDLLVGDDLRRTLKQSPEGRLPASIALDYIVQVCEGLAEAHSHGIVHRDLKPSNLFVTKKHDGTDLIKILDFGISKWSTQEDQLEELTQTGVVLGSPKYMAPEQLFGSATVDPRADVWSIGAIFFEMLVGRPPYDFPTLTRICAELATDRPPPSLRALVPELPPELEAVVLRCFARDRDHRIQNVADLAGDLLESIDAPFADQVRQKIAATLDPRGAGASMTTSSGSIAKGTSNYRSLSITGSSNPGVSSAAIRAAGEKIPSVPTASGVDALLASETAPPRRGKAIVVFAAIALLLGACALFFVFSGARGSDGSKGPLAPAESMVGVHAPRLAPALPAALPTGTAASEATAQANAPVVTVPAPPVPVPAASAAAALPAVPRAHPAGMGARHGAGVKANPAPVAAPSAAAQTAAAQTPAPPAPAPTPAPTPAPPKVNPLEDRQ